MEGRFVKADQLLQMIKNDVDEAKSSGKTFLRTQDLLEYFDGIAKDIATSTSSTMSSAHAEKLQLAQYQMIGDSQLEGFRHTHISGQSALRAGMVMNGVAATAALAFLGHLTASAAQVEPLLFSGPMKMFLFGVLAAGVAFGATYLSYFLGSIQWVRWSTVANFLAWGLTIASYVLFGVGAWTLSESFSSVLLGATAPIG